MSRRAPEAAPDRWARRGLAGLTVRAVTVVVPFSLAVGTIAALGRTVPIPDGGPLLIARYAAIFASSWAVMALAHRVLHRLLPLAALLEMSLVFPEHAPSRLRLARRVASRRDLEDLLAGNGTGVTETTQQAAERILALVSALSEHDRGTRGHSERVRVLTDLIATRMGVSPVDRDRLRWAALLHDIGKLHVPLDILNKPAKPTARQWEVLRRHPHDGARIAAPLLGWLGDWGDVIVQHHEKFDGSGYPRGLSGRGICLGARIVAVADAFDVMTATRAYKKPTGRNAALRELVACSGTHFDPDVVRALITMPQRRLLLTMGPMSWLTGLPFVGQSPAVLSTTLTSQAGLAAGAAAITGTAALAPIVAPGMTDTGTHGAGRHGSVSSTTRHSRPTSPSRTASPSLGRVSGESHRSADPTSVPGFAENLAAHPAPAQDEESHPDARPGTGTAPTARPTARPTAPPTARSSATPTGAPADTPTPGPTSSDPARTDTSSGRARPSRSWRPRITRKTGTTGRTRTSTSTTSTSPSSSTSRSTSATRSTSTSRSSTSTSSTSRSGRSSDGDGKSTKSSSTSPTTSK
jgi:putative nucleotidyltransferase with HDIG domain